MKRLIKFISYIFSIGLFLGILGIAGVIGVFYYFGAGLPDYQQLKIYEPPIVTRIYANDGRMFAEYAHEKRLFVPVAAIPALVKHAFLSAEDKTFYSHKGVDIIGIIRAAFTNVGRFVGKKRLVGASTITQQVARNFLLSETSTLVSFERKIKETILSFRIEHAYTKDHILELYLNEIFLGNRSYGVAAASLNYFNKDLDELTIAEVAYLAALPKAPSRYHPEKNYQAALDRRNWVIERMREDGYITAEEASQAKAESLVVQKRETKDIVQAGFFAEEVRRALLAHFGEEGLYESGLSVRTTMDPKLQVLAERALKKGLEDYDRRHGWRGALTTISLEANDKTGSGWLTKLRKVNLPSGAGSWKLAIVLNLDSKKAIIGTIEGHISSILLENLKWARQWITSDKKGEIIQNPAQVLSIGDVILVERAYDEKGVALKTFHLRQIPKVSGGVVVIDPHTGKVLALVGGDPSTTEVSQFNRATQAMRQLGSTIKSFIYLSALEKGLTPSTMLEDSPIVIDLGWNLGVYKPRNYNNKFLGPLSLRRALELSRNATTIRVVHEIIGVSSVCEIGERFGLYKNLPPMLSMALGAGETTLLKLTNAYGILWNGGKRIHPTLIDRVQDRHGKTVLLGESRKCLGCDVHTWSEQPPPTLVDDRETIVDPINAYQIVSILEGAVQRGTAQRARVIQKPIAAKTGTTNDFRDAFCVGGSPDLVIGVYLGFDAPMSLGEDEAGARAALPVFISFMQEALKDAPSTPFRIPPGTVLVKVNPFTGARATNKDKHVILEAFQPGTSPDDRSIHQIVRTPSSESLGSGSFY